MTAFIVGIYVVTGLCFLDALRRPVSHWAEVDREKGYWVGWLGVSAVLVLPAFVFVPAYVIGVAPRFAGVGGTAESNPFKK